ADGMGDFRGLAAKLDYLEDLGVTALWLLPFYPSPWKDDGYDIADYARVHPAYGTMRDFREFLREAHRRGLRVITELVINHTSDQHEWFQRARRAPRDSQIRDFYVWSDTPDKYRHARIIFKDFEASNWTWDPIAGAYYWHRFFSHQPDLNFDNPAVHQAVVRTMDFWFKMGIDGMRLDAIPYLYEREGTSCENLAETHAFLRKVRAHIDERHPGRMLLAEANQWPEETVPYFGSGDECHMAFHFPVMPRLFMAIRMEDRFPIIDILKQTPPIPENCQWATFLRNHDELTLEMVTDEERDYMYRVYARDPKARINLGIRRRLAPLLGNDRRTIELMNCLLFSLPGTPVLYYGDEIGMGDNIYLGDRNGVRTPMQWSGDRNAGFSRANPQQLFLPAIIDPEYHFGTVNVEAQQANPNSLLWWMKRLIALRKRYQAFGRGTIEFLYPENRKVLAFLRRYQDEDILVVVNLSRLVQYVDLDLRAFEGSVPVELFGSTEFPRLGQQPFFLTLGPHAFYWFALEPVAGRAPIQIRESRDHRIAATSLKDLLSGGARSALDRVLPGYLMRQRWFQGKTRKIRSADVVEVIPFTDGDDAPQLTFIRVEYLDGDPDTYVLPLALSESLEPPRSSVVCGVLLPGRTEPVCLIDAVADPQFGKVLLQLIRSRRRLGGSSGVLVGTTTSAFDQIGNGEAVEPTVSDREQTNSSINFGNVFNLKVYRRLEEGVGLDLEVGHFLTTHGFPHSPAVAGALDYRRGQDSRTVAVLHAFARHEGDAWQYTLDAVTEFFERAAAAAEAAPPTPTGAHAMLALSAQADIAAHQLIGAYIEDARLIGRRTAELHNVLGSAPDDPDFAPEPFTTFYQRSIYQSLRNLAGRVTQLLEKQAPSLTGATREAAHRVLSLQDAIHARLRSMLSTSIAALRIRCHGDYHLGQLLYTGKDFVVTDFEGEPLHPLSERRMKRTPLRDVTGMLRSFDYAAQTPLVLGSSGSTVRSEDVDLLRGWSHFWYMHVGAAFLNAYLGGINRALIPAEPQHTRIILDCYLIEKAIYEIGYELNNRPEWAI
ncbi:MAG TPA: maltose alpha-D-glucosyltransferase, partial [Longimicrobiales bacterium]|nr:maltose alpha-D-glucosyltransferase [Longimicrobiales bacterium]